MGDAEVSQNPYFLPYQVQILHGFQFPETANHFFIQLLLNTYCVSLYFMFRHLGKLLCPTWTAMPEPSACSTFLHNTVADEAASPLSSTVPTNPPQKGWVAAPSFPYSPPEPHL